MTSPSPAELPGNDEEAQRELLSATMQEALPLLQYVHAQQKVATFSPNRTSGLSSDPVELKAFYMNRRDPSDLGVWEVRQAGEVPVRIAAIPHDGGTVFEFTRKVKASEDGPMEVQQLPLDESFKYAHALIAATHHPQFRMLSEKGKTETSQHGRARAHVVRFFHRHGIA